MNERPKPGGHQHAERDPAAAELRIERGRQSVGLFLGPLLFLLLLVVPPDGLPRPEAARLLAVTAWVVTWWITEAVPIPVTSLLAPTLAVLCGVGSARELFAPFGDPIILLFLGSFILAEAMLSSGLDRRIASAILAHPRLGSSPTRILLAFAGVTAGLSMWLSNTATAAMIYPLALAVLKGVSRLSLAGGVPPLDPGRSPYSTALLLAIAYAASIGGIATPIGTPPNLIVLSSLDTLAGIRLPFFTWMLIATPIMLTMLAGLVALLRVTLPRQMGHLHATGQLLAAEGTASRRWERAECNTLIAFLVAVTLWILPGAAALIGGEGSGVAKVLAALFPEPVVAVLAAALLFVLPVDWRARQFTLTWTAAARIDWGTLLLFGGGLSLGTAMMRTGLAEAAGRALVSLTGARSLVALTFLFGAIAIFLTETTSNTAAAAMLAPLAIASAQAAGSSPAPPAIAVALGCSMAFMLPVATPPNAIVYGSGQVPIGAMVRRGLVLNLCCALVVPAGTLLLCRLFGLA